jgi:hypothetical protein
MELYAWDFGGDAWVVRSSRAGVVTQFKETYGSGGCNSSYANFANYVVVQSTESDGSKHDALYLHLAKGSVSSRVSSQQTVAAGVPVGLTDSSGYVCPDPVPNGAHLHYQVQQACGSWWCQSVPSSFLDPDVLRQDSDGVPKTNQRVISGNLPKSLAAMGLNYGGGAKADLAIWRPSTYEWWIKSAGIPATVVCGGNATPPNCTWGQSGDVPVPGDYNADGKADAAIYRPSSGDWYVRSLDGTVICAPSGGPGGHCNLGGIYGEEAVPADYTGSGVTDLAVWDPGTGNWYIKTPTDTVVCAGGSPPGTGCNFGQKGDIPVPADYDGDGVADLGIFRPSTGEWWIKTISGNVICAGASSGSRCVFGQANDIPMPGDYAGLGKAQLAVWRGSNAVWYIAKTDGTAVCACGWGQAGDVPVAADYNGDGAVDLGIWRPGTGSWWIKTVSGSVICAGGPAGGDCNLGVSTDTPVGMQMKTSGGPGLSPSR